MEVLNLRYDCHIVKDFGDVDFKNIRTARKPG